MTPPKITPPQPAGSISSEARIVALERENARLRGDLRTISRRLAHDLRTPLNCISTANEALRDPASENDAETVAIFTSTISESVDEAAALVARLSVVMQATADPIAPQPAAMAEIVWGALQRLEAHILKAGATIVQPPEWPAVNGVPAWLDLMWWNLISNSLKHAGAKPHIELGSENVDGEIRFWIRDSGKGVAPEKRERLVHPFERLSELNAPRGFGLPIVQRLAELQGGRFGYDASPAPSGTFFFTLPTA